MKTCKLCLEEKPATLEFFHRSFGSRGGLSQKCKECKKVENKYYKETRKEQYKEKAKQYADNNKEKLEKYRKERYWGDVDRFRTESIENRRKNITRAREYSRVYQNKRKVDRSMRSGLWRCLKGKQKLSKTFEYIGLTPPEFKIYLEGLFGEGMTWENYGNPNGDHTDCWHVDHIKPLSLFDFDSLEGEELDNALHEAWHYTNLRPLWAKENLSRQNVYPYRTLACRNNTPGEAAG